MRWLCLLLMLAPIPARAETIVAGLSQASIAITADFTGEEILVYGAVKREAPAPEGPSLEVIVTVEGPQTPVTVRKKQRRFGIWMNAETVRIDRAPSFYAIAATGPLADILTETENLRHRISIPSAIRAVGISSEALDSPRFVDALIRVRMDEERYALDEHGISLTEETLFRADVRLPSEPDGGHLPRAPVPVARRRGDRLAGTVDPGREGGV